LEFYTTGDVQIPQSEVRCGRHTRKPFDLVESGGVTCDPAGSGNNQCATTSQGMNAFHITDTFTGSKTRMKFGSSIAPLGYIEFECQFDNAYKVREGLSWTGGFTVSNTHNLPCILGLTYCIRPPLHRPHLPLFVLCPSLYSHNLPPPPPVLVIRLAGA